MKEKPVYFVSHCCILILLIFSAVCGMVGCFAGNNRKAALISVL